MCSCLLVMGAVSWTLQMSGCSRHEPERALPCGRSCSPAGCSRLDLGTTQLCCCGRCCALHTPVLSTGLQVAGAVVAMSCSSAGLGGYQKQQWLRCRFKQCAGGLPSGIAKLVCGSSLLVYMLWRCNSHAMCSAVGCGCKWGLCQSSAGWWRLRALALLLQRVWGIRRVAVQRLVRAGCGALSSLLLSRCFRHVCCPLVWSFVGISTDRASRQL
jgi:hypothetical protein